MILRKIKRLVNMKSFIKFVFLGLFLFAVLWGVKFAIAQEASDEEQSVFQEEQQEEEISPQGFEEFDTEEPGVVEESEVEAPSFPTYSEGFKGVPSFGAGNFLAGWSLGYSALMIIFYAYFAICLQFLAKKTNTLNGWFAWIPIANIFLMLNIAQKPLWWIILFLIPLVNIVIGIIIWMAISEKRGKPAWYGILLIVPIVGIFIPAYLAFSK